MTSDRSASWLKVQQLERKKSRPVCFALCVLLSVLSVVTATAGAPPLVRNAQFSPPSPVPAGQQPGLAFELRGSASLINPSTDVVVTQNGPNVTIRIIATSNLNPPDPQSYFPLRVSLGNLGPGTYQVTAFITTDPAAGGAQFFTGSLTVLGNPTGFSVPSLSFVGLVLLVMGLLLVGKSQLRTGGMS